MGAQSTPGGVAALWMTVFVVGAATFAAPAAAEQVPKSCVIDGPGMCTFRCEAGDYVYMEGEGTAPVGQVRCGSMGTLTCEGAQSFSCFLGPRPASDSAGDCRALGGNTSTRCKATEDPPGA